MKKIRKFVLLETISIFIAVVIVSTATAVPLTTSEPYNNLKEKQNKSIEIILKKLEMFKTKIHFNEIKPVFQRIPIPLQENIHKKADQFVTESIIPYLPVDDLWGPEYNAMIDGLVTLVEVIMTINAIFFGHGLLGLVTGAIIAWVLLLIPRAISTLYVSLWEVEYSLEDSGINIDAIFNQWGLIGTIIFLFLLAPLILFIGLPIMYITIWFFTILDVSSIIGPWWWSNTS